MDRNYWNDYAYHRAMIDSTYVDDDIDSLSIDRLISELIYEQGSEVIGLY